MSSVPTRVLALSALLVSTSVFAANSKPRPLPIVDTIPAPRDVAYPGTINLDVTATDVDRGIIDVRETIPATSGPLVLLAPKWLPGNHNASGQIDKLAGFTFTANGQPLHWEAKVARVRWGSPAFQAGVVDGAQIVAVDGHAYTDELMSDAITAAKGATVPIVLTVKHGDEVRTLSLPYHDGLRYPRFVKTSSGEGSLDRLLAPR
jgi:membrane-associated protease RseP (regulator of RpoE activity)